MSSNESTQMSTIMQVNTNFLLTTSGGAQTIETQPPQPPILPTNAPAPVFTIRKATELSKCKWASNYPEVQKACYLARVCSMLSPKACRLKKTEKEPIIQEGPTCGLAAISMLLGGSPTADKLLQIARHRKYTRNGEMFSVSNLFDLIESVLKDQQTQETNCPKNNVQCLRLFKGKLNCESIKQVLLNGGCLLVPYPFHYNQK